MKYNKLVRDKIPEIIISKGGKPVIHVADDHEHWGHLKNKLVEEVTEFINTKNGTEELEELADIHEVIDAIIHHRGHSHAKLAEVKKKKFSERGGFEKGIILEEA